MNTSTDINSTSLNGTAVDVINVTSAASNVTSPGPTNTIIPDEVLAQAQFWIYVIIVPVSCTCGLIGNTLASIVFTDIVRRLKQSIYRYMLALITVDALILLLALVRATPYLANAFDKRNGKAENGKYWQTVLVIPVVYADQILTTMNSMILILMSLGRLVAIRWPLTAKETPLAKHPIRIMLAVAVAAMVCMLPLPINLQVRQLVGQNGTTSYMVAPKDKQFMHYFVATQTAIFVYLPYITLMFLNFAIPAQYALAARARMATFSTTRFQTADENNQFRINTTTSIIIFMYTIFNLPVMFVQTLATVDKTYSIHGTENNLFWLLSDISNVLIVANSSTDFVIYILRTETYRAMFKERFCRRRPTRQQPTSSSTSTDAIFVLT